MWRTKIAKAGSKESPKYESVDWPCSCEKCPQELRARHGCGWDDALRGHGEPVHPDDKEERIETCPQWLAQQPLVVSVYELLADYREGRIGDVRDLPRPLLEYLRAASAELEVWTRVQQDRMTNA